MHWRRRFLLILLIFFASLIGFVGSHILMQPSEVGAAQALLRPAPTQPLRYFDLFGELLSPKQAAQRVRQQGLDSRDPISYQRIGAVQITQQLIEAGGKIFFNRKLGDTFGIQRVLGFGAGLERITPDILTAVRKLKGQPTDNLRITLSQPLTLGNQTFPAGFVIDTGLDVGRGADFPLGLLPQAGSISCAVCHVVVSEQGEQLDGAPNGNLNIPVFVALAPNSAAGFTRLNINPLDPEYQGNGKTIKDSNNHDVQLPDPEKFERAFDELVLSVPFGNFESSTDGINNTTQIPSIFTFKGNPYFFDGQFSVGPFAGLSAVSNAVHSSENNILGSWERIARTLDIDPEVYLGVVLQNAFDPRIRLPEGAPVKPSEWLRQVAPNPNQAELEDQLAAPGTGTFPNLRPNLFTYNGLIFSPDTDDDRNDDDDDDNDRTSGKLLFVKSDDDDEGDDDDSRDLASGKFLFANNAMAAWQNSLLPPPNRTPANRRALRNGSVQRGAQVFRRANCTKCHIPPFFTDNLIHPNSEIGANSARAKLRLGLEEILTPPKMYTLNTPVPPPAQCRGFGHTDRGRLSQPYDSAQGPLTEWRLQDPVLTRTLSQRSLSP